MIRCSICISTALLFVVLAGCGNSNTPANTPDPATGDNSDALNDSQVAQDNGQAPSETETAGSTSTGAIESTALKQAMIEISVDLMAKQQPNTEPDAVRAKVENAIAQIRKDVPDFLILSAENERMLQAGTQIEGVDKRIADAESFLNDTGIQLTGLVTSLLPQHKAGTLSPVRTELLAQLIVADMKKTQAALTN